MSLTINANSLIAKNESKMSNKVPLPELNQRMHRFQKQMSLDHPDWEMVVVFSKINLLYFTGSMPEGMLLIQREKSSTLWARRSYERTIDESLFPSIQPMESYREVAGAYPELPKVIYLETEFVPLAMYQRFQKHFPFVEYKSVDFQLAMTRAVKSPWELGFMEQAGAIHQRVLEQRVPAILHEGMSELELASSLYHIMLEEGHQGVARFNMFDTEMMVGQIGFGESSLYPTNFNGPGGNYGMSPAVPGLGSRERRLAKGDLVFVDMAVGVNGYHSDKTMVYQFGRKLPDEVLSVHAQCVEIQHVIAAQLKPDNVPSVIYENVMNGLSPLFLENFMGFGKRQVKFLGHAIGLTVDELPVLAKGFDEPLQDNMVFAVEPKKGIQGVGMVGIENTFVVTPSGGRCITGDHPGMMLV
jgi:Xaa-Pro aminopeptidase